MGPRTMPPPLHYKRPARERVRYYETKADECEAEANRCWSDGDRRTAREWHLMAESFRGQASKIKLVPLSQEASDEN